MIEWLTEPLGYGFALRALAELVLLGTISGVIGCWIVLYRISYGAESLAHGMLPGLVAASLLGLPLLAGGLAGVLAAGLAIGLIGRFTPGPPDTAIAVAITTLFGLGVLMALSPASQVGIQDLLFGDPLGVGHRALTATALSGLAVLAVLWRSHDRLLAVGFDRGPGVVAGISPALIQVLLLALVAVTVLVGVQAMGTLLVAAILVGPAATARLLTARMSTMIGLSIASAIIAGVAGIYLSWYAGVAAGAAVVACLLALYLAAVGAGALKGRLAGRSLRAGSGPPAPGEAAS